MKESLMTEFETLLKRDKELRKERIELECFMVEWKKAYPIMSECEKKRFAQAERNLTEADARMVVAEARLVEIKQIL